MAPREAKSVRRKGNRQLQVRLPGDHWVWTLDPAIRNQEVRRALEFYRDYRGILDAIRADLKEIKAMLASGSIAVGTEETRGEDNRLMETLDKFLDF